MTSDLFTLEGKTALVTGGARGLGLMCAQALLDHGARVIITSRRQEAGEEARAALLEHGGECELVTVDLRDPAWEEPLQAALAPLTDSLDILVNNAGVTWGAAFEEYPPEAWDRVLQLDVAAPFRVVQATLGLLEEAGRRSPPARIVNIGSVDGHAAGPFDNFAYAGAKAALHQLTRVLAVRRGRRGISVNCIAPGPVRTKMTAELLSLAETSILETAPLGRLAEADDLAGALVYLTSRAGSCVTGSVIPVDGGLAISTWGRHEM